MSGGITSCLQFLSVCLNKPVRHRVCALFNKWPTNGSHTLTLSNRLKRTFLEDVAAQLPEAWGPILFAMVKSFFKKCGTSNMIDGTEDEMLQGVDSEKELCWNDDDWCTNKAGLFLQCQNCSSPFSCI